MAKPNSIFSPQLLEQKSPEISSLPSEDFFLNISNFESQLDTIKFGYLHQLILTSGTMRKIVLDWLLGIGKPLACENNLKLASESAQLHFIVTPSWFQMLFIYWRNVYLITGWSNGSSNQTCRVQATKQKSGAFKFSYYSNLTTAFTDIFAHFGFSLHGEMQTKPKTADVLTSRANPNQVEQSQETAFPGELFISQNCVRIFHLVFNLRASSCGSNQALMPFLNLNLYISPQLCSNY